MKKTLLALLFPWIFISSMSQINSAALKMPTIAPTSPNVSAIEKFGNIPVSYTTGATSVSVPLWNIKCGEITWPFSLSYNTGGNKVDEIASTIGLGWSLGGQAVISRAVMGKPDELTNTEPNYSTVSDLDYDYLYHVLAGTSDSEMDIYSYNFNGRSGKFFIKQDGNIFLIPYSNIKITQIANGFTVVDETGLIYTFDKKETTTPTTGSLPSYTSSWHLTKVQTSDKKQSITFAYTDAGYNGQSSYSFSHSVGRTAPGMCAGEGSGSVELYTTVPIQVSSATSTTVGLLNRVDFPNGYLIFTYVSDRTDVTGTATQRLSKVEAFNVNNILLRRFTLSQSYFTPGNKLKLNSVLESQSTNSPYKTYSFEYNSATMAAVGSFAQDKWGYYNGKTANTGLLQRDTILYDGFNYPLGNADRSIDTNLTKAGALMAVNWPTGGRTEFVYDVHQYYTGFDSSSIGGNNTSATGMSQTATTTFTFPSGYTGNSWVIVDISKYNYADVNGIPYVQIKDLTTGNIIFSMENAESATALHIQQVCNFISGRSYEVKAFVFSTIANTQLLSRIQVQWENLWHSPFVEKGGGLRIRMVKNFTKANQLAATDYYEYEPATTLSSYHTLNLRSKEIRYRRGSFCQEACHQYYSAPTYTFYSSSIYPATTVAGVPLMYKKVTKYQFDASGIDKGKAVYEYDVIQDLPLIMVGNESFIHFPMNEWKNGFLLKETHYKKVSAGVYSPVKKIDNQYGEFKISSVNNLAVKTPLIREGCYVEDASTVATDLAYYQVPVTTGIKKLVKSIETTYDDNGTELKVTVDNAYEASSHDYLTKTTKTDSKGTVITNTLKYPIDFSATGNVYAKMVAKNITSPVIEDKYYKEVSTGGTSTLTPLSTIKNNYKDWNSDSLVLMPEIIQSSLNADALKDRIIYTNYNDRKQPTEVKKSRDAITSIIYGYNYQYPIAEVTYADQASIAYTSFEGDNGGWLIPSTTFRDPTAPTGKMALQFTSTISKTSVPTNNAYIVSYWKKSGTVTITGSSVTTGRTVNGWTYYEHKVSYPAPSTIVVTGSSAIIDELRLYPATYSAMSSYTYDLLVGLTSKCDQNNRITYYEYDELQRLILIRDQDKNILKKFSYNYSGQPEYTGIYYSVAKSNSFQKTGCTSCLAGSIVTYTVPANTYTSTYSQVEADNLAQADVNSNGQAYANANGTCTTPTDASVLSTISISKSVQYTFHNNCTGVDYVRNRMGNEIDWSMVGIPQGNYNVTFNVSPVGTHTFKVITPTQTFTTTALAPTTISNVTLAATGNSVIAQ